MLMSNQLPVAAGVISPEWRVFIYDPRRSDNARISQVICEAGEEAGADVRCLNGYDYGT